MASIGSFSFTQWRIAMPRLRRPKVRAQARVGVPGNVVIRGSYRMGLASGWTAVVVGSVATAQALIDQYSALANGTNNVTVIDQFGRSYPFVIVMDVHHELSQQVGGTARVDAFWTLDVGFP
jgi:hypothetical protein